MNIKTMLSAFLLVLTLTLHPLAVAQQVSENELKMGGARYLPDLVVNKVTMGDPTVGDFKVLVMNKGKGKAPECRLRLWIKDQSGKTYAMTETDQPPLDPGQGVTVQVSAAKALSAYLKYEVTTDSKKSVSEVNENNNTMQGNTGKV
jgi:hypothetical protein